MGVSGPIANPPHIGDVFRDADVHNLDEWRATRRVAVVRDDDDDGEEPRR